MWLRLMMFLGALLALFGCDRTSELRPGVSTEAEVRAKMGKPAMTWQEGADTVLEYPFTPQGTRNYMLVIGADGVLKQIDQVLTEANFARVRPGMSREEIRRLLGKPASVQVFSRQSEEVWDWKRPGTSDWESRFNVHFSLDGKVKTTSKSEHPVG